MRHSISMRIFGLIIAIAVGFPAAASAEDLQKFSVPAKGSTQTADHGPWTALLQKYVVAGGDGLNRVRYAAFKSEAQPALKAYIAALEAAKVTALDRAEQFAYWANLYNAKTVDIILDAYPVKSIKDISLGGGVVASITGGPWKAKVLMVEGEKLSLDDIEHKILRVYFKDPRVHYAVNCASFGCPNLGREAFTGANLDANLEAGAAAYINHERGISVKNGEVQASSIYKWFAEDFGGNTKGVLAHVRKYASPELKQKLESITTIDEYRYDWNLNDAPR
jgi:Protein of unknown function, DUF547